MAKSTYTAEGSFDKDKNVIVNVCIPKEPSTGAYLLEIYNLSKSTSTGIINTIFFHFSDHTETPMSHDAPDYKLVFDIANLNEYPNAISFDENLEDALFIFFHNNAFFESDRDLYFDDIERIYEEVKRTGNQSVDGLLNPDLNAESHYPRKVGFGLIKKLN